MILSCLRLWLEKRVADACSHWSQQQVATYLIIYRVADGKAWTKKTMATETLSTMNFNARSRAPVADKEGQAATMQLTSPGSSVTGVDGAGSDVEVAKCEA